MKYFYYFGFLVLGYFCFNLYNYQSNIFLNKSAYLILSKNNLNKDFGIVASISETDSLNDIIGRPVYSSEINQYYFKEDKNFINLMQPNIGISFSSEYNGNSLSISDRVMLRLPIILSFLVTSFHNSSSSLLIFLFFVFIDINYPYLDH